MFPGDPFDDVRVSVRPFYSLMWGVEYMFSSRTSLLSQLYFQTRPFRHTGLDILDRRIFEVLVGVAYRSQGRLFFQFGGTEDIVDSVDATADVTLFVNLGMRF